MKSCVAILAVLTTTTVTAQKAPSWLDGEVIVKIRSGAQPLSPAATRKSRGGTTIQTAADSVMAAMGVYECLPLFGGTAARTRSIWADHEPTGGEAPVLQLMRYDTRAIATVEEAVEMLSMLDNVEYAEPNYICHIVPHVVERSTEMRRNASFLNLQWGLHAIRMPELWQQPVIDSRRPVIAIVDTGVDVTHPDLQGNIAEGGYDFVNDTKQITDENGHGTHCAGIAAANSDGGVTGANPDALILPITVIDKHGSGNIANIVKGVGYALEKGADIISMSIGAANAKAFIDVADYAKQQAIILASAGNDGFCMEESHRDLHGMATLHDANFPAAFSNVIGVMATKADGTIPSWSNFDCDGPLRTLSPEGYNYELQVPGEDILSTLPGGGYGYMSGTSMSCPLAAGAVSRLMQCRRFNSRDELLRALIVTTNGQLDMMAAYKATTEQLWPDTFTYSIDGVECTFVRTSDGTCQVGDGKTSAIDTLTATTQLVLPDEVHGLAVTKIADGAFTNCSRVEAMVLGRNVTEIGARAFRGCTALTTLCITTATAPACDATAFSTSQTTTVSLLINRGFIGAFAVAPVWRKFTQWRELPLRTGNRFAATINQPETDMIFLIYDLENRYGQVGAGQVAISRDVVGEVVVPDTVRGLDIRLIGDFAFSICTHLSHVTLPSHLTLILNGAFIYCDSIQSVELPQYVTYLGSYAFGGCSKMKSLKLSPRLKTINSLAFSQCSELQTIVAPMTEPPYLPDNTFDNVDPLFPTKVDESKVKIVYEQARLIVPYGCRERYTEADGWKQFKHIEEMAEDAAVSTPFADRATTTTTGRTYTLTGQQLNSTTAVRRGIYIVDGRKMIVK
jgi:hypothetical protein